MPHTSQYQDPAIATLLSAAFTVFPTVAGIAMVTGEEGSSTGGWLIISGLTLGPAIGYFSAGRVGRGFAGLGVRTLVLTGTIALVALGCQGGCSNEDTGAKIIAVGGFVITAGLAAYDIATVRRKVPVEGSAHSSRIRIYPTYVAATKSPGLGVNIEF